MAPPFDATTVVICIGGKVANVLAGVGICDAEVERRGTFWFTRL